MKILPAVLPALEKSTLLAVSPYREDSHSLARILDNDGWTVQGAQSVREATQLCRIKPDLILCEEDLPDGNWKDIFRVSSRFDNPPPIVVVSRHADERLWAEVLNLGGYDLLLKPFEKNEVSRVIGMARRHGRQHDLAASHHA